MVEKQQRSKQRCRRAGIFKRCCDVTEASGRAAGDEAAETSKVGLTGLRIWISILTVMLAMLEFRQRSGRITSGIWGARSGYRMEERLEGVAAG